MKNSDFDIACNFYKAQLNKAFTLTYDQKLTFSALFNQAKHGPFSPEKAPDVGIFDFVGKERRARWQALGNMTTAEAQDTFVQTLLQICPQFAAQLEVNDNSHCENGFEMTSIRKALNAQTLEQFRAYAAQYYPDSEEKQTELIAQLQDRHFHQYMIYVNANASTVGSSPSSTTSKIDNASSSSEQPLHPSPKYETVVMNSPEKTTSETTAQKSGDNESDDNRKECLNGDLVPHIPSGDDNIAAPQMWTRKDIIEFKALLSKDSNSVLNIGSGELVTIRFPIDSNGNVLVWEFATDDYDIGFGLSFEWAPEAKEKSGKVVNEIQQTPNDDTSDRLWNYIQGSSQPPENSETSSESVVVELIPMYRRTSHAEVFCGSHKYPAHSGTYILKFDNTYSYWRNKMLYYRVYWTK
nr:golgi resident protein gcp60 [Hymenolepis microstoma]